MAAVQLFFLRFRFVWLRGIILLSGMVSSVNALYGNIVGVETQNFHPITSGLDFVTVHSSETLDPGYINVGLYLNYAVNTLPYFDDETTQSRLEFNDTLLSSDFNVGVGILPNWDIGISIPSVLAQDVKEDTAPHGQYASTGNTEVRINTKLRFWGNDRQGIATILSANINRLEDNPYTGANPGPTYNIELAGDITIHKIALALNLGYRIRESGEEIQLNSLNSIEPMKHQFIASAAASYLFSSIDTKLIYEMYASWPTTPVENNTRRAMQSNEALLGLKYDIRRDIALQSGVGSEIQHGLSSPDWRIYLGVNYTVGPTFKKKRALKRIPPKPDRLPDEPTEQFVIHDILFEFDSASLVTKGSVESLRKLAQYLKEQPNYKRLVIEGHTDSIGTDQYNVDLSKRRAQTIVNWLTKNYSIKRNKIFPVGKGEREPIADNGNYQGRQLNRRVVFKIYR